MTINLLNGDALDSSDIHFDPDSYTFYTEAPDSTDRTDITRQLKLTDMKTIGEPYGFDQNEYLRRLSASGGTKHDAPADEHGPKETGEQSPSDVFVQGVSDTIEQGEQVLKNVGSWAGDVLGTTAKNTSEAAKNVTKPISLIAIAVIVLAVLLLAKGPKL